MYSPTAPGRLAATQDHSYSDVHGPPSAFGPGARSVEAVLLVRVGQWRLTHGVVVVGSVSEPGGYLPRRGVPEEQQPWGRILASLVLHPSASLFHALGPDRKQPTGWVVVSNPSR